MASKDDAKGQGIGFIRTLSTLISRLGLGSKLGMQFGGKRNLYDVFGYRQNIDDEQFMLKYQRQDICSRIIDAPPGATWSDPPTMVDADAELIKGWEKITKDVNIWQTLYQVDRLARLGHYAILVFGYNDTGKMERQAVVSEKLNEVLYVKAFGSRVVGEIVLNDDDKDKRFGLPVSYTIKFDNPGDKVITGGSVFVKGMQDKKVHWSRVVHVVDNPLEDQIFSTPIIEKVFNLLDDLLKVVGGTSETYWLTANRGMQANIDKDMDIDPADADALTDEIEEYQHQLRRFIRTRGVELNVLESSTPSPQETFTMLIAMLSGATGIPQRILIGSESGSLASEQDRANWADRVGERRVLFAEPVILNPVVVHLQNVGLLPKSEFSWEWPSAFKMSPLESSMVMAQTARAIGNISRQTGNKTPMQLTSREEARDIIGLEGDLKESDIIEPEEESPSTVRSTPDGGPSTEEEDDESNTNTSSDS